MARRISRRNKLVGKRPNTPRNISRWILGIGAVAFVIAIWIGTRPSGKEVKAVERCETYVWEEICTPPDTVFTRVVQAGRVETVIIPPNYRLEWWGNCGEYRSNREKVGILLFRNFNTAPGIDSTQIYFHLFLPEDPHQTVKVECDEQNVPPREDEAPPEERSDPHTT